MHCALSEADSLLAPMKQMTKATENIYVCLLKNIDFPNFWRYMFMNICRHTIIVKKNQSNHNHSTLLYGLLIRRNRNLTLRSVNLRRHHTYHGFHRRKNPVAS